MSFKEINKNEFDLLITKEDCLLIDVREAYEHEDHNLGGVNIPMGEILSRTNEFLETKTMCLYCQSGKRSKTAAFHLTQLLPSCEISSLQGGMKAYFE